MAVTYYAPGQWNYICDLCGKKGKSSDARKTWDGRRVCSHHNEVRNPQDFIRGVVDDQSAPWTRTNAGGVVKLQSFTVATLPPPFSTFQGDLAKVVTDAISAKDGTVVAGGGDLSVIVHGDGVNWIVGY